MMHMFGYGYGGWGIGMFLMMIFCIAIVFGVILLIMKMIKGDHSNRDHAFTLLDEKFANGKISEAEYIQKKNIMKKK